MPLTQLLRLAQLLIRLALPYLHNLTLKIVAPNSQRQEMKNTHYTPNTLVLNDAIDAGRL